MAVDFAGFSKMVDALGDVDVYSTTPLEDELGTVLNAAATSASTATRHSTMFASDHHQVNGDYDCASSASGCSCPRCCAR